MASRPGLPGRPRRALAAVLTLVLLAGLPPIAGAAEPTAPPRADASALSRPVSEERSSPVAPGVVAADPAGDAGSPADTASFADPAGDAGSPADPGSPADRGGEARDRVLGPGDPPSQGYLDSLDAEQRDFLFTPGGRVTLGFTPRADDHWPVGGRAPRALPAGRRPGAAMAGVADPATPPPSTPSGPVEPGASAPPAEDPGTDEAPVAQPPDATPPPDATATPGATPTPSVEPAPPVDAPAGPSPIPAVGTSFVVAPEAAELAPSAVGMRREVHGFLPYWEVADSTTRVDFSVITHMAYFSVGVDGKGNLKKRNGDGSPTTGWAGWTSSKMTALINAAHQKKSRVTLTITAFAWSTATANVQRALLGSSAARLNLAKQAAAAIRDRGADGINLDFEPLVSGYEDEFVALVRTMRAQLDRVAPGYHLSFDTLGYPGNYPLEGALASGGADAVFVMGYDYRTSGAKYAGSIDPLAGPAYDLTDTVRSYTARVPAGKVILGVPYYGRAWSTTTDDLNAATRSNTAKYGSSVAVNYENAIPLAAEHGRRYDATEVAAWTAYRKKTCTAAYGCVTTWRQVYYDDAATLRARYDLVNRAGLRGAGMWALGYEGTRTELNRALADKFLNDTTPPLAGIEAFSNPARRDEGFVVAWTAADDWSGIRSYDVQVSTAGGAWAAWLTKTTATSATFLGVDGKGYAFRVRARDGKGNTSPWNVASVYTASPALASGGFLRVTADTLNVRAAPDTSASRLVTAAKGDVFAITGGPRSADGFTWYRVTGPLSTWGPVGDVFTLAWIAVSSSSVTNAVAVRAPNSAVVTAGIRSVGFGGAGAASLGTSTAAIGSRSFSPDGDGSGDRLAIRWNNRLAFDTLELRILRADGSLLGTRDLARTAAGWQEIAWDGTADGAALADGPYLLQLVGTADGTAYRWPAASPAANGIPARVGVRIDRVPPKLESSAISGTRLSPNGDGTSDAISVTGKGSADAVRWEVLVTPAAGGSPVRRIAGTGRTASAAWKGTADDGSRVRDGSYRVAVRVLDAAGNAAARSWSVTLDTTPPALALTARPERFSPDGDGTADTTRLAWSSSEPLTGKLVVSRGTTRLRAWAISGTAGSVTWNGRDAAGRLVADGRLTVTVRGSDALANRASRSTALVVDRTAGSLRWSPTAYFPQDGDRVAPTSIVSVRLARSARVTLRILDASGAEVRRPWSGRELAAGIRSWRWDGRTSSGAWAPQGSYTAELTAVSSLGTTVLRRTVVAAAFRATPSTTTPAAGSRLVVTFRSVEPLGRAPRAALLVPGRSALAMSLTRLADGSWRAAVLVPAGATGRATVSLRGRDTAGGSNRMSIPITIR
jgi:spore germination protein YaaH/flagellar hook assembly protein FlgD